MMLWNRNSRDHLRNICLNKSIQSRQYRNHLENVLNNEHEDETVIMRLMKAEDQKQAQLLGTMKKGLQKVDEGQSKDSKNWINQSKPNVTEVTKEVKTDERILTTTNEITNEILEESFYIRGC